MQIWDDDAKLSWPSNRNLMLKHTDKFQRSCLKSLAVSPAVWPGLSNGIDSPCLCFREAWWLGEHYKTVTPSASAYTIPYHTKPYLSCSKTSISFKCSKLIVMITRTHSITCSPSVQPQLNYGSENNLCAVSLLIIADSFDEVQNPRPW